MPLEIKTDFNMLATILKNLDELEDKMWLLSQNIQALDISRGALIDRIDDLRSRVDELEVLLRKETNIKEVHPSNE
jgi:hypothetical protein